MKAKFFRLFFSCMILMQGVSAYAQEKAIKSADKNFMDLQYQQAIKEYTSAWNKLKDDTADKNRIAFQLGECYRMTSQTSEAVDWYALVADTKFAKSNPIVYLHYAEMLRETGGCEKASTFYKKYLENEPNDQMAKAGLSSCENLAELSMPSRYTVTNAKNLNSTDDDYGTAFSSKKHDEVFFSSNRLGSVGKEHDNWTGAWFSDLYQSDYKNSNWQTPISVDETKTVNTAANEGTPVFNSKLQTLYFTRCDKAANEKVYCKIMKSGRHGPRWTRPEVVLADANSNIGQPALSGDELVIYFASDRDGGIGGKDIWKVTRERKGKAFGEPINLGPTINTAGDEMFPYLQGDTVLYFSSNGHPGLGGLDLFKSSLSNDTWSEPENLHPPMNSNRDDFAIVFKNETEGFFSSNRNGGMGGDDIYEFVRNTVYFTLSGIIKDENTLATLADVDVVLSSSDGDTAEITTDSQGFYSFDTTKFNEDKTYLLSLSKENYFSVSHEVSTFQYPANHDFVFDVLLKPIPEEPIVLPDILYDVDKWDLKPQYQDSLVILVKILNDNPSLVIELGSHTDSRAGTEYNDELSQKRAQSVVDFLVGKNIDGKRLIAKGYGERVPRKLKKDFVYDNGTFTNGTTLSIQFIEELESDDLKEHAYELNRRTVFKIVSKNFNKEDNKTENDLNK